MQFLVISVLLNALLGVIFRCFTMYKINNFPAIVVNYIVCFAIGAVVTNGDVLNPDSLPQEWIPVLLGLGLVFIVSFNFIATTVQTFGITVASLVQKMSVLLVVIFAIVYYHEALTSQRMLGLVVGFISIFLITGKPKKSSIGAGASYLMVFPIIIFLLGGGIDSTFVYISKVGLTAGRESHFAAYLFGTAGAFGLLALLYTMIFNGRKLLWKDILAGVALGIPNFFSVYFIQKMLTTGSDGSVVFPIHNIGILLLSAIVSKIFFSEKFTLAKILGVLLATAAILILALTA